MEEGQHGEEEDHCSHGCNRGTGRRPRPLEILSDTHSEFAVRALTREVNSEKARALARLGAEVVAADVDDLASLQKAFADAYGASVQARLPGGLRRRARSGGIPSLEPLASDF